MKKSLKTIFSFFALSALLVFPFSQPAAAEDVGETEFSPEEFCEKLPEIEEEIMSDIEEFESELIAKREEILSQIETMRSELEGKLEEQRQRAKEIREELYALLREIAAEMGLEGVVEGFIVKIEEQVALYEQVIDGAVVAYQEAMDEMIAQFNESFDEELVASLKEELGAVFTEAQASCESGDNPSEIYEDWQGEIDEVKNEFESAKEAFKRLRRGTFDGIMGGFRSETEGAFNSFRGNFRTGMQSLPPEI